MHISSVEVFCRSILLPYNWSIMHDIDPHLRLYIGTCSYMHYRPIGLVLYTCIVSIYRFIPLHIHAPCPMVGPLTVYALIASIRLVLQMNTFSVHQFCTTHAHTHTHTHTRTHAHTHKRTHKHTPHTHTHTHTHNTVYMWQRIITTCVIIGFKFLSTHIIFLWPE